MSFSTVVLAVFLLQTPGVVASSSDPVFQSSQCKAGYEWSSAKKKCVKKERDY